MEDQVELNEIEKGHLRALELFYEAHGKNDLAKQVISQTPEIQRLNIRMYHQWLEHPKHFGVVYKWTLRFLPVIRAYTWWQSLVVKLKKGG